MDSKMKLSVNKVTNIAKAITVLSTASIRDVMLVINRRGRQTTIVVVDENRKILGTVTDGDIRRGLLHDFTLDDPVNRVMNKNPIVVPRSISQESMLELMSVNDINSLPIVDKEGRLLDIQERFHMQSVAEQDLVAVVMAGGEGTRLRPLTENMPKPMLKVAGKPILQILLECMQNVGFKRFIIIVGYMGHVIQDYFKDGQEFGMTIDYIKEHERLGTAGALGNIPQELKPKSSFLVINGDLMTDLNFRMFREFHVNGKYSFTLCGRPHKVTIPFGYPIVDGDLVTNFQEKPTFTHLVNSGIYCLSQDVLEYIPKDKHFNMTEVIDCCVRDKKRIGMFPLGEKFHEIGRIESYEKAEKFYEDVFNNKNDKE